MGEGTIERFEYNNGHLFVKQAIQGYTPTQMWHYLESSTNQESNNTDFNPNESIFLIVRPLEYLHELQNIYYDFTGQVLQMGSMFQSIR